MHCIGCVLYYILSLVSTCFFGMVGGMLPNNLYDAVKCNTSLISKSSWIVHRYDFAAD